MLIPSIDLMSGKVVQLVHGDRKELEFNDLHYWIERFLPYPMVQVIDLDAAMGKGSNLQIVKEICQHLPCQVGGGIRTPAQATTLLAAGAKKVIIGSSLLKDGAVNVGAADAFRHAASAARLIFAVDSRNGKVVIKGWKEGTELTAEQMMRETEEYCGAFLYTHIDTEGTMQGIPFEIIERVKNATSKKLIAAGGIRSMDEVDRLHAMGVDAVVGMALYKGVLGEPNLAQ